MDANELEDAADQAVEERHGHERRAWRSAFGPTGPDEEAKELAHPEIEEGEDHRG
jgi:hypothetical protein